MLNQHQKWEKGAGKYNILKLKERISIYNKTPVFCKLCNKSLDYTIRKNKFCNHNCAAKFTNKERTKRGFTNKGKFKKVLCSVCNTSIQILLHASAKIVKCDFCKDLINHQSSHKLHIRNCIRCNKTFSTTSLRTTCSMECLSDKRKLCGQIGGLKSAANQSQIRRSKNEKYFAELCIQKFLNVLTNQPIFNGWDADIILPDLKVAILWNGIWHYTKITKKHSVSQVQKRDFLKEQEILKKGYTPYIIKDLGKFNPLKVAEEFEIFCKWLDCNGRQYRPVLGSAYETDRIT